MNLNIIKHCELCIKVVESGHSKPCEKVPHTTSQHKCSKCGCLNHEFGITPCLFCSSLKHCSRNHKNDSCILL